MSNSAVSNKKCKAVELAMQNSLVALRNGRLRDRLKVLRVWHEFMDYHKRISAMDNELVDKAGELWMQYFDGSFFSIYMSLSEDR
jgi:hypothetical protein